MDNLSLEDVVSCFNAWRMVRKTRKELISKNLRTMATSLYPSHKRPLISMTLYANGAPVTRTGVLGSLIFYNQLLTSLKLLGYPSELGLLL